MLCYFTKILDQILLLKEKNDDNNSDKPLQSSNKKVVHNVFECFNMLDLKMYVQQSLICYGTNTKFE